MRGTNYMKFYINPFDQHHDHMSHHDHEHWKELQFSKAVADAINANSEKNIEQDGRLDGHDKDVQDLKNADLEIIQQIDEVAAQAAENKNLLGNLKGAETSTAKSNIYNGIQVDVKVAPQSDNGLKITTDGLHVVDYTSKIAEIEQLIDEILTPEGSDVTMEQIRAMIENLSQEFGEADAGLKLQIDNMEKRLIALDIPDIDPLTQKIELLDADILGVKQISTYTEMMNSLATFGSREGSKAIRFNPVGNASTGTQIDPNGGMNLLYQSHTFQVRGVTKRFEFLLLDIWHMTFRGTGWPEQVADMYYFMLDIYAEGVTDRLKHVLSNNAITMNDFHQFDNNAQVKKWYPVVFTLYGNDDKEEMYLVAQGLGTSGLDTESLDNFRAPATGTPYVIETWLDPVTGTEYMPAYQADGYKHKPFNQWVTVEDFYS
ncbi:unknown [Streptococcus phage C1]|uniref:Uncharacterized protein n=1 Tax=Streptococcus phage C1 TaxID=2907838 RepID=Q7Y3E9_BPSC1|nr:hypothetical protein C1p13 [Streptococcus phage C1]AAP42312.1 unknown [Streptococcus phage C1]